MAEHQVMSYRTGITAIDATSRRTSRQHWDRRYKPRRNEEDEKKKTDSTFFFLRPLRFFVVCAHLFRSDLADFGHGELARAFFQALLLTWSGAGCALHFGRDREDLFLGDLELILGHLRLQHLFDARRPVGVVGLRLVRHKDDLDEFVLNLLLQLEDQPPAGLV